ncbi:RNA polymerase II mediator complex subunit [Linnemannia zychae]|nr:RNA polymerase II mediator complex subunit [Linnemannia zychae]
MSAQDSNKRIKLNLERSLERLPFDITQKAEEIYLPDGNSSEKLKRKIKVIADAAGDYYDQYTENAASSEEPTDGSTTATTTGKDITFAQEESGGGMAISSAAMTAAANMKVTSPQGIYSKLWHAQSEIGIALDVLNIIISSFQQPPGSSGTGAASTFPNNTPPTALPPGSLKCEYVPKPILVSAQIQNEKLALGAKRQQLRNAADILLQGAQKLKRVVADEDQFWASALRLRRNNWCLVSSRGGKPGYPQQGHVHLPHGNRLGAGSQLFVHYGFKDVGSLYGERAYAELVRNPLPHGELAGEAKTMELFFPNKTGKVLIMSLIQQGSNHIHGPKEPKGRRGNTLHTQLLEAQDSLFDGELFHDLVNEARTMANSVTIVDNEILVSINDELELRIAYRCPTSEELRSNKSPKTDLTRRLDSIADTLRYAIQLIQHRRYRQNIKERIDNFFKSSRPGGGRTAGSFGQIQQTLQQRPTSMLSMMLQMLQYYSFARKVRDVLTRSTWNLRQSWWEPIHLQSVDIKFPTTLSFNNSSTISLRKASVYGLGTAVSIRVGKKASPIRFVVRSQPVPCVVLQLPDRPPAPLTHIAEFEKVLEQELTCRAIGRTCDVLNSITTWSESMPGLHSPKFVIDIEQHCVGVFAIRKGDGAIRVSNVHLDVDMRADRAISIVITCNQDRFKSKRLFLEDQTLNGSSLPSLEESYHSASTSARGSGGHTMETFRSWLQRNILAELEF